jgi:signal peptidase I
VNRRLAWVALAAATTWLAARRLRLFRVLVQGRSMEPAILPGDQLLVAGGPRRIRRGDVVVVRRPGLEVVKRVAGLPGERVAGETLGPDRFLVVGDNPAASTDGRSFGPVSRSEIVGVVLFRYWPRAGDVSGSSRSSRHPSSVRAT